MTLEEAKRKTWESLKRRKPRSAQRLKRSKEAQEFIAWAVESFGEVEIEYVYTRKS